MEVITEETEAYILFKPKERTSPMVFDSPHSGTLYPQDFGFNPELPGEITSAKPLLPRLLRQPEDTYVDDLYKRVVQFGAPLLVAKFPRTYIDLNRSLMSIFPEVVRGGWSGEFNQNDDKAKKGVGLIWMQCVDPQRTPIYKPGEEPDEDAIRHRIDTYYTPYHAKLAELIKEARAKFPRVFHINCHSMPSRGWPVEVDSGKERPHIVLGNRDIPESSKGPTCSKEFINFVEEQFLIQGYTVEQNFPYAGVEIIKRHAKPEEGIECLQIEIGRQIYESERTLNKFDTFSMTQEKVTDAMTRTNGFANRLASEQRHARSQIPHSTPSQAPSLAAE
ncbi:MAG: hydrolase [Micavibrio sp.]|nr:MAG: hydrolase [Micavibrio sp.]